MNHESTSTRSASFDVIEIDYGNFGFLKQP